MKTHHIKILPHYFEAVIMGLKTWEIRINDRSYMQGDIIMLHEFDVMCGYTGRAANVRITYIEDLSKMILLPIIVNQPTVVMSIKFINWFTEERLAHKEVGQLDLRVEVFNIMEN